MADTSMGKVLIGLETVPGVGANADNGPIGSEQVLAYLLRSICQQVTTVKNEDGTYTHHFLDEPDFMKKAIDQD